MYRAVPSSVAATRGAMSLKQKLIKMRQIEHFVPEILQAQISAVTNAVWLVAVALLQTEFSISTQSSVGLCLSGGLYSLCPQYSAAVSL